MAVKIFCGEKSKFEHELNQLDELYNLINDKYSKSDDLIYILTNFRLSNIEIDVLILTVRGMAIIDLKSIKGKVIGNENGDWKVITENGKEVPLKKNLFQQMQLQKYALRNKLNRIQIGNFEHIEKELLGKIQCWGYFEKGSSYNKEQLDQAVHVWFDVITADKLIKKTELNLNVGYLLRPKDMDAIVAGLNLKGCSIAEFYSGQNTVFETNYKKQINVFSAPNKWNEINKKLSTSNILIVIGEPRVGKTTTIANIAKNFKESGWNIHDNKEALKELFILKEDNQNENILLDLLRNKNVFMVDDIFGDYEYESKLGNDWVKFIIKILETPNVQSKILIAARTDVFRTFLKLNPELRYKKLQKIFENSIVELNSFENDNEKKIEIFEKNLKYVQSLDINKKSIIEKNQDKIISKLVLPGEIWDFLYMVNNNDFQEKDLDIFIDKAKRQVNFVKEEIKLLNNNNKIFLYILYINQNNSFDDLNLIYSKCFSDSIEEQDFFTECIKLFKDRFIKIKDERELTSDKIIKKIEFIHPNYRESIENLLIEEPSESEIFDNMIFKLYNILRLHIDGWDKDDQRYSVLRFNIFRTLCHNSHERTKDLIFEILDEISGTMTTNTLETIVTLLKSYLGEKVSVLEEFRKGFDELKLEYYTEFLNNYMKFDDEITKNYLIKQITNMEANPYVKYVIAYIMALEMDSKTIKELEYLLDKFDRDSTIDLLTTIFVIKHHKELQESGKTRLNALNNKDQQIRLLIQNYGDIDETLKKVLDDLVSSSEVSMPIETIPQVLMNFETLPEALRNKHAFIFESSDEKIKNKIKEAFELWVDIYVNDLDNEVKKWQDLDEKVRKLYITWLKGGNYSKQLYGYSPEFLIDNHFRLFYKWIFYWFGGDRKTCFIDRDNTIYIIDIAPSATTAGLTFENQLTFKEEITPRLREQIPLELLTSIQVNIISLLKTLEPTYFLCWNNVLGNDSNTLFTFFEENGVKWENNKTKITNDGQRITISNGESRYSIYINNENNIATIKDELEGESWYPGENGIDVYVDGGSSKQIFTGIKWFTVKNKNGRLELYYPPIDMADVMWVAFLLADNDKPELVDAIIKAIEEDSTVLKAFFGDCEHFYEYPFKLSDFQEELLERMLQYSFPEMESDYDRFCDQRNRSDVLSDINI